MSAWWLESTKVYLSQVQNKAMMHHTQTSRVQSCSCLLHIFTIKGLNDTSQKCNLSKCVTRMSNAQFIKGELLYLWYWYQEGTVAAVAKNETWLNSGIWTCLLIVCTFETLYKFCSRSYWKTLTEGHHKSHHFLQIKLWFLIFLPH